MLSRLFSSKQSCSLCSKKINGINYRCIDCPKYYLCSHCKSTMSHNLEHFFVRFEDSNVQTKIKNKETLKRIVHMRLVNEGAFRRGAYQLDRQNNDRDFICDGCNETKVVASLESVNLEQDNDIRYRCLVCRDFDLCSDCEGSGYHCEHMMIRITQPIHRNIGNEIFLQETMNYSPVTATPSRWVVDQDQNINDRHRNTFGNHEFSCDCCNSKRIEGVRFKCIDCPNYDMCSHCESVDHHSGHLLVRIVDPVHEQYDDDFIEEIMELRVSLTSEKLGEVEYSTTDITGNDLHTGVRCDKCEQSIQGCRYKCLDCPDFDLCARCERGTYHFGHLFIRIVEPLGKNEMNRLFVDTVLELRSEGYQDGDEEEYSDEQEHSDEEDDADEGDNGAGSYTSTQMFTLTLSAHSISLTNKTNCEKHSLIESAPVQMNANVDDQPRIQACSICYDKPSNVTFAECGHLCICSECLNSFLRSYSECPLCKTKITCKPIRVYY